MDDEKDAAWAAMLPDVSDDLIDVDGVSDCVVCCKEEQEGTVSSNRIVSISIERKQKETETLLSNLSIIVLYAYAIRKGIALLTIKKG